MTLDALRSPVRTASRVFLLVFTVSVSVVGGTYVYPRERWTETLENVIEDGVTVGEALGVVTRVDVLLVAAGLVVVGVFADHLAATTDIRGTDGE